MEFNFKIKFYVNIIIFNIVFLFFTIEQFIYFSYILYKFGCLYSLFHILVIIFNLSNYLYNMFLLIF